MHTHIIEVTDGPAIIHYQPYVGGTFSRPIASFKQNGVLLDVSSDTFVLILEAAGVEAERLELGSGIEFEGDGIRWTFTDAQTGGLTKDANYTYILWWTRNDNGHVIPLQAGNIRPQKHTITDL